MGMTDQERVANEAAIEAVFDQIEVGLNVLREQNEKLSEAVKKLEASVDQYDGFVKDGDPI
jgi:hypothetical protein